MSNDKPLPNFNNINLSRGSPQEMVARFRRDLARQLGELVADGTIESLMTVGDLITYLNKPTY